MDTFWSAKKTNGLLVFLLLFISSRATQLATADFMLFLTLLVNIVVMIRRGIRIDAHILFVIPFLAILIAQNYYQSHGQIEVIRYVKFAANILTGYCTVKILRFEIFKHYTKFIYYAVLMSLPFYLWQQVSLASLHAVGTALNNAFPSLLSNLPSSQSILFYTIEFVDQHRCSGPMWEPGGFGTVIFLAMYFELLMNNFRLTKRMPVYLLGMAITFSTTGYMLTTILAFVFLLKFIKNKNPKLRITLYVIVLPMFVCGAVAMFFTSDIMYSKISTLFDEQLEKAEDVDHVESLNLDVKYSLGRFGSLVIDFMSMKDSPMFGRGYDDYNFRNGQYGSFELTNGLTNYIARMGILGFIWLIISLHRSGKLIVYGLSGRPETNLLKLFVPFIAFSNPVLFTPFFIMLSFFFIPFKPVKNPIATS